jgi:hypothetical protein
MRIHQHFKMPVTSSHGLLLLLQCLEEAGYKLAAPVTVRFKQTLERYNDGDDSMIERIQDGPRSLVAVSLAATTRNTKEAKTSADTAQPRVRDVLVHVTPTSSFRAVVSADGSETMYCLVSLCRAFFANYTKNFGERMVAKFNFFDVGLSQKTSTASFRRGSTARRDNAPAVNLVGLAVWILFLNSTYRPEKWETYKAPDEVKEAFFSSLQRMMAGDFSDFRDV